MRAVKDSLAAPLRRSWEYRPEGALVERAQ